MLQATDDIVEVALRGKLDRVAAKARRSRRCRRGTLTGPGIQAYVVGVSAGRHGADARHLTHPAQADEGVVEAQSTVDVCHAEEDVTHLTACRHPAGPAS